MKTLKKLNREWLVLTLVLYLPFFSYVIPFVDRTILNVVSVLCSLIIVNTIYKAAWRSYKNILILVGCFLILFAQFSKTAVVFDLFDGMATLLRYVLYVSVILSVRYTGMSNNAFRTFSLISYILCGLSIFIGLVDDHYIFINGQNRFLGASHSASALSMQLSIAITLILVEVIKSTEPQNSLSKFRTIVLALLFLLFLSSLIETGSRQPLLGLTVMFSFVSFIKYKKIFVLMLIPILILLISYTDFSVISEHRFITTLTKLWSLEDLAEISSLKDSSLLARINFFIVGSTYVAEQNPIFGAGLNAFPGIYEMATGKGGVAPHNDFLLLLVEFGYIGMLFIVLLLIYLITVVIKRKNIISMAVIILWVTGFSLNNVMYYHPIVVSLLILFLYSNINIYKPVYEQRHTYQ